MEAAGPGVGERLGDDDFSSGNECQLRASAGGCVVSGKCQRPEAMIVWNVDREGLVCYAAGLGAID